MPRLFTGVEIPPEVAQALSTLRGGLPGARWIDPENYHVTLRFIGDVDDDMAHEVESLLGRVRRGRFELRIEGLTSFGSKKPRVPQVPLRQQIHSRGEHGKEQSHRGQSDRESQQLGARVHAAREEAHRQDQRRDHRLDQRETALVIDQ